MFGSRRRRRERARNTPLPPEWLAILDRNVPYTRILPPEDREELAGLIQIFLAEKEFEGCDGLEITDEVRVTIAAQACLLLLHRETDGYPGLRTILVYPHTYVAPSARRMPGGLVEEGFQARLGESWSRGAVVLSWDAVKRDASDIHDGHNLVLHEFAHQLDDEDGAGDGAPLLPDRSHYVAWARVLGREYAALLAALENHRRTLIDPYGATNPAEFFAVVTEFFFERPRQLRERHPELYEQFARFYRQDPAALFAAGDASPPGSSSR